MLERIRREPYAEIVASVRLAPPMAAADRQLTPSAKAYNWTDQRLFASHNTALDPADARQLLKCPTEGSVELDADLKVPLTGPACEVLKGLALDVILPIDLVLTTSWANEFAKFAPLGLWYLGFGHLGDDPPHRADLNEVLTGAATTSATLYAKVKSGGVARTISTTQGRTDHLSSARSRNANLWKSLSLVPRALRDAHRLGQAGFLQRLEPDHRASASLPAEPAPIAGLRDLCALALRNLKIRYRQGFFRDQWELRFRFEDGLSPSLNDLTRVTPPRGRSWADPHLVHRDGRYFVFMEEVEHSTRRGHIAAFEITSAGTCSSPRTIIKEPYHLAYPFVFEWQGQTWLIPDSKANRTIDVYRCEEFPYCWTRHKTLMSEVAAVDSTLLPHDGRWWLFTNQVENDGASSYDELFLYHADHPLSDHWEAHPASPIVSDARRARPAGRIFTDRGRLFRPAQDCGPRYGYAIRLFEIERLDRENYAEVERSAISPEGSAGVDAVHTLARAPSMTMVDCAVSRWRWSV